MALNFFDYGQLTRGTYEGDQQDTQATSSQDTCSRPESKTGPNLRVHAPELRRLHSETTLRAPAQGVSSPQSPRSPTGPSFQSSQPATSAGTRRDVKPGPLSSNPLENEKYPATAHSPRTDATGDGRTKSLTQRSLHKIRLVRPKSKSGDGTPANDSREQTRPMSGGQENGKDVKRAKRKSWKESQRETEQQEGGARAQRSRANTMRDKASNVLQQLTNLAASRPPQPARQAPAMPFIAPELNSRQSHFLAESLAHVTVGEWLYKDHNRPSLVPRTNPFRRTIGPPPRGSTGLPQRRWFRISPYDRKVMWSSKWDASSLDQLKSSRQVPVDLVFETVSNALFTACLPSTEIPFKRSIVIVAPQRIVKVTAPDEERHRLWLTALRYIADSTVKLDEGSWAAELRARFKLLNGGDLSLPSAMDDPPAGAMHDHAHAHAKVKADVNFFVEKPLPPSPPRSTFSRTTGTTPAITPPAVPRWSKHGKQRSDATNAETVSSDFRLPSRGSDDEPVPALELPRIEAGQHRLDLAEDDGPGTRSAVGSEPRKSAEVRTVEEGEHEEDGDDDRQMGRGGPSKRQSRRLSSDEFAVDQMEMLVDRLGAI